MRIAIREQLALLVLLCSLIAVAVLSIATWVQNYEFVVNIRTSSLALTASLKAAQAAADLLLYETSVRSVATRVLVQSALQRYNNANNNTAQNWVRAQSDIGSALAGSGGNALLLQAVMFPKNGSIGNGLQSALFNVTGDEIMNTIRLPYTNSNGTPVYLGDDGLGYPPALYPNLTYTSRVVNSTFNSSDASVEGEYIGNEGAVLIGPYGVNATFSIVSVTVAVVNNTSADDILAFMTVLLDARMLFDLVDSPEGLDRTGQVLLIGPTTANDKFTQAPSIGDPNSVSSEPMKFLLPPQNNSTLNDRHSQRSFASGDPSRAFLASAYPAVVDAFTKNNDAINNAGALISTHNEEKKRVSVGYATLTTSLVNWVLIVEQSHDEVVAPIRHLRNILVACVFGTIGIITLIVWPLAHVGVKPIRQLRAATKKTVEPYIPDDSSYRSESPLSEEAFVDGEDRVSPARAKKEGFLGIVSRFRPRKSKRSRRERSENNSSTRRRTFRIPGKVPESKHWLRDELTDLTGTFNEMSDELVMQYERLEQRVQERTAELEQSKKAAEAANESKTLFIANISHELKTPLNGILGMCAVSMQDTDLKRIRQSLGVIYKSGDLLLHLLTDLLTFSKNSIGQQLSLDEKEFRLGDISSQLMSIFEKQAKDGNITLKVVYQGPNDAFGNSTSNSDEALYGPFGTGRVRDMCLWGDKNRILQVLINLTSNSLKFTPANGVVEVRIRCVGLADITPPKTSSRKGSLQSKQSKTSRPSKRRGRTTSDRSIESAGNAGSTSNVDEKSTPRDMNSTLSIKVDGETKQIPQVAVRQRSLSPPLNTKQLAFEFEVEDTGPGIPEDQQQKVFEPFVQGDLGLTKKYGGTGLGLSICAQLAGLMGGNISLNSTLGIGSTFCMRIPLRWVKERAESASSSTFHLGSQSNSIVGQSLYDDPPKTPHRNGSTGDISISSDHSVGGDATYNGGPIDPQPRLVGFSQPFFANPVQPDSPAPRKEDLKRAKEAADKDGRKVRVLVAEDNQVNQQVVLRMLKLEDIYDVTVAKDGQVALDLVRASMENGERFDLIFMDIQMPNLDGIQSTKRIRDLGFNAPIVALTAFSEESNVRECLSSGMDDFMQKPIKRPQLKAVIKKYCATIPEEPDREKTALNLLQKNQSSKKDPSSNRSEQKQVVVEEKSESTQPNNHTQSGPNTHLIRNEGTDSEAVSPLS